MQFNLAFLKVEMGIQEAPCIRFSQMKASPFRLLYTLKERVESSSGLFSVESQKGEGTLIQTSWAL